MLLEKRGEDARILRHGYLGVNIRYPPACGVYYYMMGTVNTESMIPRDHLYRYSCNFIFHLDHNNPPDFPRV